MLEISSPRRQSKVGCVFSMVIYFAWGIIEMTIILNTRPTLLSINSKTFLSDNEISLKRKLRPMEMKASGENDDRIKGAAYMILQDRFCYSGGMKVGCLYVIDSQCWFQFRHSK